MTANRIFADSSPDLQDWRELALCQETDPEAFFPEKGGSTREPKKVCMACEVRVSCLEYALVNPHLTHFGIWGAKSERERRRIRREQQQREAA